jgi:hypothetical protein
MRSRQEISLLLRPLLASALSGDAYFGEVLFLKCFSRLAPVFDRDHFVTVFLQRGFQHQPGNFSSSAMRIFKE